MALSDEITVYVVAGRLTRKSDYTTSLRLIRSVCGTDGESAP